MFSNQLEHWFQPSYMIVILKKPHLHCSTYLVTVMNMFTFICFQLADDEFEAESHATFQLEHSFEQGM